MGVFVEVEGSGRTVSRKVGYIIQENGCWEWVGSRTSAGYGKRWQGGKLWLAHRLVYTQHRGPIPKGMQLDHFACENKGCVNPDHLRPVSARENLLRSNGMAARNAAKTHCPEGHPLVVGNLIPANLRQHGRACLTCSRER